MEKYSPAKKSVIMTRQQVRSFDCRAINTLGIDGLVLMENAGRGCAEFIKARLAGITNPKVAIFCGTGNNGGDGYVIARHLLNSGFKIAVMICGDRKKIKGDAKTNLSILERIGKPVEQLDTEVSDIAGAVKDFTADADMLVDSLFGTGLTGAVKDNYQQLIESINAQNRPLLAVDIPSGLDCDTGKPLGAAIKASWTITFVAVKTGFTYTDTAAAYTGDIFVASIGVEPTQQDLY